MRLFISLTCNSVGGVMVFASSARIAWRSFALKRALSMFKSAVSQNTKRLNGSSTHSSIILPRTRVALRVRPLASA